MKIKTTLTEKAPLKEGKWKAANAAGEVFHFAPNGITIALGQVPLHTEVEIDVETEKKGDKEFKVVKGLSPLISPPALPLTTVATTPAPGGEPVVQKAGTKAAPAPVKGDKAEAVDERMSKSDWAMKDYRVGVSAIYKSTIEALPGLVTPLAGVEQKLAEFDRIKNHILEEFKRDTGF
jgi:hypothetical protein